MKSRVVAAVVCAIALLGCSYPPAGGTQRMKEEAERMKQEAEKAKAEAEKAAREKVDKALPEVMKRWNAVAETMPADLTNAKPGFGVVKYTWGQADQFPHPTYKGGSAEAYAGFGRVLLAFLQNEENFKYLADNQLFTAELRYVFPSGQVTNLGMFAKLAEQFSAPDALGKLDDDSRKALKAISDRIRASIKGAGKV